MIFATTLILTSMLAATAPTPLAGDGTLVMRAPVDAVSSDPAVATISGGTDAKVAIGNPFWLLKGTEVVGAGTIFLVTPTKSVGRFTGTVGGAKGITAVVVREARLVDARESLPEGVTLRGKLMRLPPGRRTGWLDLGSAAGLRRGDMLLISRGGVPIARGQVADLDERTALASLRPVVGNAQPEADDTVELWPAPAERQQGRLNTVVLDVLPGRQGEGPVVRFPGSKADGVVPGRLVDLFRQDRSDPFRHYKYVGAALIEEDLVSDPISGARMYEALSIRQPAECDVAIVRPAPPDQPIRAAISKVETGGEYCLIAAGESDGVQVGETFVVYRDDPDDPSRRREAAELVVDTVKYFHSGANVRMLNASGGPLLSWEFAERRKPAWRRWGEVGVVKQTDRVGRWATADIDPRCKLQAGQIVRWSPIAGDGPGPVDKDYPPGAGLVLAASSNEVVLYVPAAWGDSGHLDRARIEVILAAPAKP